MLSFCGIDVSKDRLDVVVLPEGWFFSVSNDTAGWAELVVRLLAAGLSHLAAFAEPLVNRNGFSRPKQFWSKAVPGYLGQTFRYTGRTTCRKRVLRPETRLSFFAWPSTKSMHESWPESCFGFSPFDFFSCSQGSSSARNSLMSAGSVAGRPSLRAPGLTLRRLNCSRSALPNVGEPTARLSAERR
jgi:hypothetical protein